MNNNILLATRASGMTPPSEGHRNSYLATYVSLEAFWRIAQEKAFEEVCNIGELNLSERQRGVI